MIDKYYHRQWRKKNPKKSKVIRKRYYSKPGIREKYLAYHREYHQRNKAEIQIRNRIYRQNKLKNDIQFRINYNIRREVQIALRGKGTGKKLRELLGYSIQDLKKHIEKQFDKNMSWKNWGTYWHIDHIKPQRLFKFTTHTEPEFKKCWALKNLRPLEKMENMRKGGRYK